MLLLKTFYIIYEKMKNYVCCTYIISNIRSIQILFELFKNKKQNMFIGLISKYM